MSEEARQWNNFCNALAENAWSVSEEEIRDAIKAEGDNSERFKRIVEQAVETAKRKQVFEVLNSAYDLVIEFAQSDKVKMNRDEFKNNFSGIADDFKIAKLRYESSKQANPATPTAEGESIENE